MRESDAHQRRRAAPAVLLTILFDLLREDCSCYKLWEKALDSKVDFFKPFTAMLQGQYTDTVHHTITCYGQYTVNKSAYLLTALMCHSPQYFSEQDIDTVVQLICGQRSKLTEMGILDALTNLLKP